MPIASIGAAATASYSYTLAPKLINGTSGDDSILGSALVEIVRAGDGRDTVSAGGGNDEVYGENGNDALYGDTGNDMLDGGIGDDFLDGGTGQDRLYGGEGADTLVGRTASTLNGDGGNDILYRGDGGTVIDGGTGIDELRMTAYGGGPLPYYYRAEVDLEAHIANIADSTHPSSLWATNTVSSVENIV